MQLRLKNINKIKDATINLNGFTIIAGQNDTGKSTIGKILFAIIKAIANTQSFNEEKRAFNITEKTHILYKDLVRIAEINRSFSYENASQKANNIITKYENRIPKNINELTEKLLNIRNKQSHNNILEDIEKSIFALDISPAQKAKVKRHITSLQESVLASVKPEEVLKKELTIMFQSEFLNQICTFGTDHSEIGYIDDIHGYSIEVILKKNKIHDITIETSGENFYPDATFVESPLYLHLLDTLLNAQTIDNKGSILPYRSLVNFHVKDIAQKLEAFKYVPALSLFTDTDSIEKISEITGGEFVFDKNKKSLFWAKGKERYAPFNVASGIKAFGVLQILLQTEAIDESKILIWDEPENHLHPEWQIRFAHLLLILAQKGIPILVSSHSPYFIQGIRYFANKLDLDNYVNYYLTEEEDDKLCKVDDVTNDLNRVFAKLAEPMNEIINL